ncbi:phage integrase family protein [Orenia metallireducens]|uniref:Phage integrase family protein n=1 Tax=Orenia metallireducens TaxID=1413210 RepID=A0A285I3S2_9FIRM|nr:tyrosine-type recombinase/integrase [Orenia metallireducens]PRX23144.1 phage integrase family protein [Orenia metallireducens]SNY42610.1 Phage integrase family protein [Orenia metallireducens]
MGNRVEPIRSKEKIREIKQLLKSENRWRDYVLFVCGINFGLRIGDLLRIKIKDIIDFDDSIRTNFEIIEEKTEKRNIIKINQEARKAIELLLDKTIIGNNKENYLIYNLRDYKRSISRVQAYNLVQNWCRRVGIVDLAIGTHTLRKTWGYHAHQAGISIEVIQLKYKHASTATTRHYLGIEQKDVDQAYDQVNL